MRKRNLTNLFDNIFWYILYLFPIIAYLCMIFVNPYGDEIKETKVETEKVYTLTIPADTYLGDVIGTRNIWSLTLQFTYSSKSYNLGFTAGVEGMVVMSQMDTSSMLVYSTGGYTINDYTFVLPREFKNLPSFRVLNAGVGTGTNWSTVYTVPADTAGTFVFSSYDKVLSILPADLSKTSFKTFFDDLGFTFATDNIITNCLSEYFGADGILPLFANDTPFILFSWFICVFVIHLVVDFLLFIPRLAHKWMNEFGGD